MRHLTFRPALLLAFSLWLGLIAAGYAWLLGYSFVPGQAATAPRTIPSSLVPPVRPTKPQLFLALHPRCPCSKATVRELAKILSRAPGSGDVTVLMFRPATEPDSWMDGALLDECRRMHCTIRPDPDGRLSASLGSLTSGQVVLYDASGTLRYEGGITASRGHEGDNAGELTVIDVLQGKAGGGKFMPVFGCPIQQEATNRNPR